MTEMIQLKCRCGAHRTAVGAAVDLAEFLRCAIGDGWRRINEDPVKAVATGDETEIILAGTCAKCDLAQRDEEARRGALFPLKPAKFQKAS
jgi:hypothetical protein